ncbi:hypothetical protein [Pseudomonas sp. BMS12]|uniref:hypothetical protein n=1 Tax=Pseudomonas sp. BMS12 TaxID=1796033 RepID=UPI000AA17B2D|nr:hypothetical protein [Pseudomonas sp. BMS12]
MKRGFWLLLLVLGVVSAQAGQEKVYLLATAGLTDTSVAQSIFLHEPDITDLAGCQEAVRQGQRHRDWQQYHHILRNDKAQGFSLQMQYQCVIGAQQVEPWFDRARYRYTYLIKVDKQSKLAVQSMDSMASCFAKRRALPALEQERSHCSKGNQRVR